MQLPSLAGLAVIRNVVFIAIVTLLLSLVYFQWDEFQASVSSYAKVGNKPRTKYYIKATFSTCAGLGNQMFRFASLFGMGVSLDRRPYFDFSIPCNQWNREEMATVFPKFYSILSSIRPTRWHPKDIQHAPFGDDVCKYEDPCNLANSRKRKPLLVLSGNYLQSFRYFDDLKEKIREIFSFAVALRSSVDAYAKWRFGSDRSHRLCVHTRLGDFKDSHQQTKTEFARPAIYYLVDRLKKQVSNVSLVLLGVDKPFLRSFRYYIMVNGSPFTTGSVQFKDLLPVYIPKNMSRGEDLYFASTYCDSLLLTSSASTFGWWMGYLMPEGRQVFYNWNVTSFGNHSKERYDYDYFPGEWTGLRLLPNRTVVEFSKWHYEVDSVDGDSAANNAIVT